MIMWELIKLSFSVRLEKRWYRSSNLSLISNSHFKDEILKQITREREKEREILDKSKECGRIYRSRNRIFLSSASIADGLSNVIASTWLEGGRPSIANGNSNTVLPLLNRSLVTSLAIRLPLQPLAKSRCETNVTRCNIILLYYYISSNRLISIMIYVEDYVHVSRYNTHVCYDKPCQ